MSKVTRPVAVAPPPHGVVLAESVHAANFRMPVRADPFHKLIYVLRGRVVYRDRHADRELSGNPGTLLAVDKGTAHELHDEQPATLLLLCLAPSFITADAHRRALWSTVSERESWHVPPDGGATRRFENLWRRALLEQNSARPGGVVALHALAAQILVTLARMPVTPPRASSATRRIELVAQEVAETFYDEWTLDRAAARAGFSRRRFSELFRDHAGNTFLDTLTTLRLDHAQRLLEAGAHSVTGVAFSCGYRDLSHFYRVFRKRFGRPPGGLIP